MEDIKEYDIPYAYELFNRITASTVVNGQPLWALLLDDTHNLWHCFAQSAFIEDCVAFSITKKFADVAPQYQAVQRSGMSFKYFLVGGLAFVVTLVALIGMRFGPKRVVLYSVDRLSPRGRFDFRIERVYQALAAERAPYVEVFHTVIGKRFVDNLLRRRRAAIYLEGLEWAYFLTRMGKRIFVGRAPTMVIDGLEGLTPDEQEFAKGLIHKYLSIAPLLRYRTDFLTWALRGRTRVVFAIDDARRYQEFMIAAARIGAHSYAFQHSHVTPYHVGWLASGLYRGAYARPDYFVAWNEYWKEELLALNSVWPEGSIIIAGSPKETSVFAATRALPDSPVRTIILAYETHAPQRIVKKVLDTLVECADVRVVIKIRPDLPAEGQLSVFGTVPNSVRVITNLTELAEPVTAVLGTYSTFLYDAVEAGLPVGLIKTPLAYTKRMVLNGLADDVTVDGACAAVGRLAALTTADIGFRQKVLSEAGRLGVVIHDILVHENAVG